MAIQPVWANAGQSASASGELIIRAMSVEGLQHLSDDLVLDAVTKSAVGELLNPQLVHDDLQAIIDTGYFLNVEASLAPEEDGVRLIFFPTENPVVEKLVIETEALTAEALRKFIRQQEGEVLNHVQLEKDLEALEEKAATNHGYVMQPVDVVIDEDGELVIFVAAARLGEISIKGNAKTKEHVIRRELTVESGEFLNIYQLEEDLRRVLHLGFFDEVRRAFHPVAGTDRFDVEVEVEERVTGTAGFGAGYSSMDGLLGYLEFSEDNFLGRGEQLGVRAEFGERKTSYELSFHEPYLMGSKISFGTNLYNTNTDRTEYENDVEQEYSVRRVGGDVSLGRPLGKYTQGWATLKLEDSETIPTDGSSVPAKSNRTRSLTLRSKTDTTDHPFYPLLGMRTNVSGEFAGSFFGGDTHFTKYIGEVSRYFKVGRADQTIAMRAVGGIAHGDLPFQDEFRVGGAETLRGYKYGELRGDRMIYGNAEYRFQMSKIVQGAIFVDAGQAWKNADGQPDGFKIGYGAGLRLDTPLGIMRFDYGIGEKGGSLFFSIGPSF